MDATLDNACLPKNELAAELVRSCGELRLRVVGTSMLPAIWPHDVLTVRGCRIDDTAPGDIVLYTRGGRLFAHRVVARSGAALVTRGDGIGVPDPVVDASELLGRVTDVLRRGKWLRPGPKLTWTGSVVATLVCRSARLGRALVRLHGLRPRARP